MGLNYVATGQMSLFDLDTWSGKTSTELSQVTEEKTSVPSLKKPLKLPKGMPLFLDLRTDRNGRHADISWEIGGALPGEDMTLNIGECRRDESESVWLPILTDTPHHTSYLTLSTGEKPSIPRPSKLSEILETNPDPKYNLSAKACQVILSRADRRVKELPEQLRTALERQCHSKNEPENLGGGKGILIQNERTGALSTLTNQSVCAGVVSKGNGEAFLSEEHHTSLSIGGGQAGQGYPCVMDTRCLNPWDVQSKHIQPQDGTAEALYSGECRGGGGESYVMQEPILLESNQNHATIQKDGVSTSLPASMGMGGGYIPMVCQQPTCFTTEMTPKTDENGVWFSLRSRDYKDPQAVVCIEGHGARESHRGDGYAESETMYTLNTVEQHAVCIGNGQVAQLAESDVVGTLNCMHDQQAVVTYGLDRASFNQGQNAKFDFSVEEEVAPTVVSRGPGGGYLRNSKSLVCKRLERGR